MMRQMNMKKIIKIINKMKIRIQNKKKKELLIKMEMIYLMKLLIYLTGMDHKIIKLQQKIQKSQMSLMNKLLTQHNLYQ